MMAMRFLTPVTVLGLAISLAGCANTAMVQTANGPMPQYCLQNNTATGALIGGALGAALGGALGGGR
ncbi:MAG TPA: hypothetical protein VJ770_19120, partial [Stellaceae bacterium]|nr:hypothetical protein [Stellaceae bacterium]